MSNDFNAIFLANMIPIDHISRQVCTPSSKSLAKNTNINQRTSKGKTEYFMKPK